MTPCPRKQIFMIGSILLLSAACASSNGPASFNATTADATTGDGGGSDVPTSDAAVDAPPSVVPWPQAVAFAPPAAAECLADPAPADDPLAELLEAVGEDRTAGIQRATLAKFGGAIADDPARLPFFHDLQEDMDGFGACWARDVAQAADQAAQSDHPRTAMLATLAWQLGLSVQVGGPAPAVASESPLIAALAAVHVQSGAAFDEAAVLDQAAQVPPQVQRVVALLLLAELEAAAARETWLAGMGEVSRRKGWFDKGAGLLLPSKKGAVDPDQPKDAALFDLDNGYDELVRGALRLLQATDEGHLGDAASSKPFAVDFATPLGRVVLRGGGDDVWDPKSPELAGDLLLALDTGGNDTWLVRAGANTSANNPVALAIDLAGDDTYTYATPASYETFEGLLPPDEDSRTVAEPGYAPLSLSNRNRQGAGRLGIGILLDLGDGRDHYRALRMAQGYANFGVGVLWDEGGDDVYEGEAAVQGAAVMGLALAYDGGGHDQRRAFHQAQGFAFTASGALLYDRAGNDDYTCVIDQPLVYPSPQTMGLANASLCQGVGFGARRDNTGTHRSGGLGVLRDLAGSDNYLGATFVQGVGYWFGIGLLADGGGDDQYDGLFYAQAAAAHFALGFLVDSGGKDLYDLLLKPMNAVLGVGHDFSSALLVEGGGDDHYRGSSRSLGAAKCHGYGLLVERGGNDHYAPIDDKSVGWATDYDWAPGSCGNYGVVPSWGLFVDQGGKDLYAKPGKVPPKKGEYGDGQLWVTDDPDEAKAKELSGGIDGEGRDCGVGL
jgi:hypothetical protein